MRRDRTAVLHFLAQLTRSLAGFGTTLFTARYFGANGLGFYSQILALLFWLKLPSNSVKTAVSKRMSETEAPTGHFTAGILSTLSYGLVVGLAVVALEAQVNDYLDADAAHLLILLLTVNIAFDIIKSGLIGRKQVAVAGWLGTGEQILRLGSQVTFVLGGSMVIGLVYGHVLSLFAFSLAGIWLLRDRITVPRRRDFDELRQFAQYSWLGNLQGVTLNWMDVLVLGLFVGDDLVGIYTAAWTLASFLSLASKSIRKTLFPELSDLGVDERYDRATSLVSDGLEFAGIFLIPGAMGAVVLGDRVLAIYQSEFSAGGIILVLLILARTFQVFGSQFVGTLNGLDYPEIAFRINAVFILTNAVLNVILIYQFGWYGAAVATLTSTVVYLLVSWYALKNEIGGVEVPWKTIVMQTIAALAMAGVVATVLPILPSGVGGTLLAVVLGAGIYGILLMLLSTDIRRKILTLVGLV